jgi:hypothetical protein
MSVHARGGLGSTGFLDKGNAENGLSSTSAHAAFGAVLGELTHEGAPQPGGNVGL